MAHLENYTASQVGKMLSHYGREEDDGVKRSNENIRPDATALNYVVFSDGNRSSDTGICREVVRRHIAEKIEETNANRKAKGKRKMDSRATVMSDWVFTLPKDWPAGRDPREFFQLCLWFVYDRYGEDCYLPGFVHMDETTPHMHCPIVPMIDGEIRKRDVVTRTDCKRFHSDLQSYLDKELGFHVTVLLDESQTAEKAKSRMSQDEMKALNADIEAKVQARVEAEVAERQRELDSKASEVARGKEANKKEAGRLNRLSAALEEQKREQDERDIKQKERDSKQDERERELKALEVKLDTLKGKLEGIRDFVMGWVHWIRDANEKERAARLEKGAEAMSKVVVHEPDDFEDESHEDELTI